MADSWEIRAVTDSAAWDRFVRDAIGGSIFSSYSWLDCAQKATGNKAHCYGFYKNGRLLAGLSGLEHQRKGTTKFTTPNLTPHGGLLYAPIPSKGPAKLEAEWGRATRHLIDYLGANFDYIQLAQHPAITDMRPFIWAQWDVRLRYTYQLDLGDIDAVWERFERRTRTVIRNAEKNGFQLEPTDDIDLLRRQYEMIYYRQGGPVPEDSGLVARFAQAAFNAGLAQAFAVRAPTGEAASIVVFVNGFDTVYAWLAGADPAFTKSGATSLLYWKFLQQSTDAHFDFVGANIPAIALFKRGFGGDLVSYCVVEGYKSKLFKNVLAGTRAVRNLLP